MSQNFGALPTPCHTMLHFVDSLPPLTCDVIYRWPVSTQVRFMNLLYKYIFFTKL